MTSDKGKTPAEQSAIQTSTQFLRSRLNREPNEAGHYLEDLSIAKNLTLEAFILSRSLMSRHLSCAVERPEDDFNSAC